MKKLFLALFASSLLVACTTAKKVVESPAAADALLAQIGVAYSGDPLVLTQIAGVSQLVMCPKCPKAPAYRKVWVAALERARDAAKDDYVKTFCRQQLWWCGYRK